ncbi:MAG: hypothetical protein ACYC4N_09800 [Pirellulaceae bacterium]
MESRELGPMDRPLVDRVLGYLNFSSGAPDPQFLAHLNELFAQQSGPAPIWRQAVQVLEEALPQLSSRSSTFSNVAQASAVLRLLREGLLPAYREFHADLLFHQSEETLFGAFFVGRACEAILQQGGPWDEGERIIRSALSQLNDYIGHRPVAALETRRHEPYPQEWVRPVPLYIEGAGVELGRHHDVVMRALEILRATDENTLRAAQFDPAMLAELAFDPRAYDFDHPVNKRPNHHFGQWDPHHIDNAGRYRRFVVQQVTLDALMGRVEEGQKAPYEQLLFEAAAVLAGTILMASGISGSGPGAHDSTVTLSSLLPSVAAYRDAFYEQLIEQAAPKHRQRLERESRTRRQPFGGARQHLNAWLARRRASQLEHVHLAKIFARMGYAEAANRQAGIVPVASARMLCEIDCRLTAGNQAVQQGDLPQALALAREIVDLLNRAIRCGAVVDPWNLLGFDAHFSLFPALENSVHDHRADELVALMEQVFGFFSRIWSAAAAEDNQELCQQIRPQFQETANWWWQFAAHEVSSVDAVDAGEVFRAAQHVAESLNLWHKGGAETGDIRFWAPYAHRFDSPKAFSLVIEALLERDDFVASMALLIHWLGEAARVPLEQGVSSFHQLAQQWLLRLLHRAQSPDALQRLPQSPRQLVGKFFDCLEANADEYWNAPTFSLRASAERAADESAHGSSDAPAESDDDDEAEEVDLFSAAYEGVVYDDSTDDGVEGSLFDTGETTADELSRESERIYDRMAFLSTLARLWKLAAVSHGLSGGTSGEQASGPFECMVTMRHWIQHAITNHQQLLDLLDSVRQYRIPMSGTDPDALMQYDHQRLVKDALLERIAATCVDVSSVAQTMLAALAARSGDHDHEIEGLADEFGDEASIMVRVIAAVLRGDNARVTELWPALQETLAGKSLLYVPLSKEGNSRQIVAARCRQCQLQDLLAWLPRRGMWLETCQLIETARGMERNHPVGPGAVTEFDELFKVGYRALVENLVASAKSWPADDAEASSEKDLAAALEELTEVLLASWLSHSRTLRLSVLERITDKKNWDPLVRFIQQYGAELFTQRYISLGNARAILHQGVGNWLARLERESGNHDQLQLLQDLDRSVSRQDVIDHLSLILEAILENYGEYRDYNSTTTQSDRGDMLYTLLDFLRLRTEYDRICWHLKPVILAHEILVSRHQEKAARLWRRALTDRIGQEAEQYLTRLRALQKKYAIRMPTIADRIAERFVRPMAIDRMRALVRPAMDESRQPGPKSIFDLLERETQILAGESTGIGFDVPVWLLALEEEVDRAREPTHRRNFEHEIAEAVSSVALSRDEIRRQLDACTAD